MKLSWQWWKFFRIFHRFRRITRLSLVVMMVLHVDSFFNLRKWQHLWWPCFSADSFSRPISGGLTTTFARMTSWRRIGSRLPSQVGITWYELMWSNDSNLLLAAGWCRGMIMDWYELQDEVQSGHQAIIKICSGAERRLPQQTWPSKWMRMHWTIVPPLSKWSTKLVAACSPHAQSLVLVLYWYCLGKLWHPMDLYGLTDRHPMSSRMVRSHSFKLQAQDARNCLSVSEKGDKAAFTPM